MINNSNYDNLQLTWQAILWRLLLTGLLLLILATSGMTIFSTAKSSPNAFSKK